MKKTTKLAAGLALASTFLAALPANAITVSFGGQNTNVTGGDMSGLTSPFVPVSNIIAPSTGYFIETFDLATNNYGSLALTQNTNPVSGIQLIGSGASFNSYGGLAVTTSGFAIQRGTTVSGAAPANDSTYYAFGAPNGSLPGTAKIDYSSLLSGGAAVSYLGLYYGSIDTYNNIAFYNGNALITGAGLLADGIITGQEILDSQQGTSGDQFGVGSNVYVNLFFGAGEAFTAFEFRTTGIAFEVDNVVVGLTTRNVPEPASLALFGIALVGLVGMRGAKRS